MSCCANRHERTVYAMLSRRPFASSFAVALASGLGVGYAPVEPGTLGTL